MHWKVRYKGSQRLLEDRSSSELDKNHIQSPAHTTNAHRFSEPHSFIHQIYTITFICQVLF